MIKIQNVIKKYDNGVVALKDINLEIQLDEFVFIIGKSGSGKSTLMKLITREEICTEGQVLLDKINVKELKNSQIPYYRRNLGIVFQDFRLLLDRTVHENIAIALRIAGGSKKNIYRRIPSVLNMIGLLKKSNVIAGNLSGGEQQRVAIARAIVNNPNIIIADEPTGNLDPESSKEVFRILQEINRRGVTVIVITHEREIVSRLKKRVIFMADGKIVSDTPEGMYVS